MSRSTINTSASSLGLEEFYILQERVKEYCGIELNFEYRSILERKLRERLLCLDLSSFSEYVLFLQTDSTAKNELEEAVDLLTTHETYFFREQYQLDAFRNEVLPLLIQQAQNRKHISIWSAGCSSGEEVYSLATILLETPELHDWHLLVYGSDISKKCLSSARRGIYGPSAFRVTPDEIRKKWFTETQHGFEVHKRIREICHFGQINLLEPEHASAVGRVDAIFCRNVFIYLTQESRRKIIETFYERLYPGGVLLLGHSESLLNTSTDFELLHLTNDLVYRRPLLYPTLSEYTLESVRRSPINKETTLSQTLFFQRKGNTS